jgi:hypothetical protein
MNDYLTKAVFDILKKNPSARDNVLECVQYVHDIDMAILFIKKTEYYDAFFGGKLSSVKTIDRIWRKIQEDVPELRGSKWEARQAQSGRIEIADLSYLKNQLNLF